MASGNFRVEIDQQQLADIQSRLAYIKNGAQLALARALNKTAAKAKTQASTEIRKQIRLSASYVRDRLQGPADVFAYKATTTNLSSQVATPYRGVRLDNFLTSLFPYRAGKPTDPIKVKVKPSGAAISIASAFWVRAKNSGGYLIAVRNDVLRAQNMKIKLSPSAYTVLSGPSLAQVFNDVKTDIKEGLSDYLSQSLDRETAWLITKNPPPGGDGSDGN